MSFSIDIQEESGVRTLHFGSEWIQGAMRIARPWDLELEYTREMMAALLLRDDSHYPRNVLQVGLGAASITKYLYRNFPDAKLTIVEIEPRVVAAARHFFKLPDDPKRIRIEIADGLDFIQQTSETWDLILIDGFDPEGRAGGLDTIPFYAAVRAHLSGSGIMSVNLLGYHNKMFEQSVERIRSAFDGRALSFPSCDSGNTIAFAAAGEPVSISLSELKQQASLLKEKTGLNLHPAITRLEQAQTCPNNILTL